MSGYLLDTNVISELAKTPPDARVMAFLASQDSLWVPVVALHEIEFGIRLLPPGRRRDAIEAAVASFLAQHESRVLPLDKADAACAAEMRAQAHRSGRVLRVSDALIAGAAKARGLIVATRNVKDFAYLDVAVVNPWSA